MKRVFLGVSMDILPFSKKGILHKNKNLVSRCYYVYANLASYKTYMIVLN